MSSTGRYNLVQIGSIYLTKTGMSTGTPCRTAITGLDALKLSVTGLVVLAIDGTPYTQIQPVGMGFPVSVLAETMQQSVFDSVVAALQTGMDTSTSLRLKIEGDTGNFDLSVIPSFPEPIKFNGEFNNGRIKDVRFNFIISQFHNVLTASLGTYQQSGNSVTLTYSGA